MYKIMHILLCVPSSSLGCFPSLFDSKLCGCFIIVVCMSDDGDLQATFPFFLGG